MLKNRLLTISATSLLLFSSIQAVAQINSPWVSEGPAPNTNGQVEGLQDGEVVGSINAVSAHPTDSNIVYVGGTNGGIWRTNNAMDASPNWIRQSDNQLSNSIGALAFDPLDATNNTLVAGIGRSSSIGGRGGERIGVLRTTDGGASWTLIDGDGQINGCNIRGIAARGDTLVIGVNTATAGSPLCGTGIFRSTDAGDTWTQVTNGIPTGTSFDIVGDPVDTDRLYTNITGAGAQSGIFRSDDQGASWVSLNDAAIDAAITGGTNNLEMSTGVSGGIFAVIVNGGVATDVFGSTNGGDSWTAMDTPAIAGLSSHPGGQGSIHLSIAADRTDANIVYLGGDRQDFPNSIGAGDFSGRVFRGDISQPAGSQWVHLTHDSNLGPAGGGTASDSAPHADSRDMAIAANNILIETDDGGIYRRTSPLDDTGDWFSMNGNITTTELHSVSYDGLNGIIFGGTQDTGVPQQTETLNPRWSSVVTADGGVTLADDSSTPNMSIRYSSTQFLGGFRRQTFDQNNNFVSQVFPPRTPLNGAPAITAQFYTPLELNTVNALRIIFGGGNGVYESLDQGATVAQIGPGIAVNQVGRQPIAYGATGNEELLYVGSGSNVFIRTTADPDPLVMSATYPGTATVSDIVIPSDSPDTAFVADSQSVFQTTDLGATWTDITNNLGSFDFITLRALTYVNNDEDMAVVVSSDRGVYAAFASDGFSTWSVVGSGLPNVPVYDLEYNQDEDLLLASLLGRGAWTISPTTALDETFFTDGFEAVAQ